MDGEGTISVLRALAAFFLFGTLMCTLTVLALSFPGGFLEPMWRLNPEAHAVFQTMGGWAILLMLVVGTACLFSAIGLWRRTDWGRRLAIAVLLVNIAGDTVGAIVRRDPRTLIGLPIGGAMIAYLVRRGRSDAARLAASSPPA